MLYGVIDIGSNSVRLMLSDGVVSLEKKVITTKLSEGLAKKNFLLEMPMARTCKAIFDLVEYAKISQVDKLYVFATEALRSATNSNDFINMVKIKCGVDIEVISSETEAKVGFFGAYNKGICCVVDIGGASTEIVVGNKKKIYYSKSVPIGVVKIRDICEDNKDIMLNYIDTALKEYGEIPSFDMMIAIGGTGGTVVAVLENMVQYDPKKVHNYILNKKQILDVAEKVRTTSMAKRGNIVGLSQNRADIIVGGCFLLAKIMQKLNVENLIVSESDNLEGYLKRKLADEEI
ncbi:MAG: hypothetical protein RR374_04750 [Clostridia bacterium]